MVKTTHLVDILRTMRVVSFEIECIEYILRAVHPFCLHKHIQSFNAKFVLNIFGKKIVQSLICAVHAG